MWKKSKPCKEDGYFSKICFGAEVIGCIMTALEIILDILI